MDLNFQNGMTTLKERDQFELTVLTPIISISKSKNDCFKTLTIKEQFALNWFSDHIIASISIQITVKKTNCQINLFIYYVRYIFWVTRTTRKFNYTELQSSLLHETTLPFKNRHYKSEVSVSGV